MITDRETELREMLAELQRSYREAAKPLVDELAAIELRKPPKPIFIPCPWPEGEEPQYIKNMLRISEADRDSITQAVKRITGTDEI